MLPRLILLLLLLTACNCAKKAAPTVPAPLWVPGLTLPANSTEQERFEETGRKPFMLFQHFNNPAGWLTVSAHFEAQLQKEGYKKVTLPPGVEDPSKIGWSYSKRGAYFVTLSDNSQLIAIQKRRGKPLSAQYTLTVMEWK